MSLVTRGGGRPLVGKPQFGEASTVKSGVPPDEMGRPVPSVAGEMVIQSVSALGAGLMPVRTSALLPAKEGLGAAPGEGRSDGCSSGQAGAPLLPAMAGMATNQATSPLCPAVELDKGK